MSGAARIFVVVVALVILAVVVRLVGARRLRSKYALLWLVLAIPTMLFALVPALADWCADRLGVEDAPALLLTMACAVLLLIVMQFSWELSRLEVRTRRLAEETALLRERLRNVEDRGDA
jgi:hypothetical protein